MAAKRGRPSKPQGTTFVDGGVYYFKLKVRLPNGEEKAIKQTSGIAVGRTEEEQRANFKAAEKLRRQAQAAEDVAHERFRTLGASVTVQQVGDHMCRERETLGVRTVHDDEQRLTDYWYPELGTARVIDVRTHHIIAALRAISGRTFKAGKQLSQKTMDEAFRVLKMLFDHAIVMDLREANDNPCMAIKPLYRRSQAQVDPRTHRKTTGSYSLAEVGRIISDEGAPSLFWRCVFAVEALAMTRASETARLRFRDWRPDLENLLAPVGERTLGELWTDGQKTKCPRWIPVHPALGTLLAQWYRRGFYEAFGRLPQPEDFMFPYVRRRGIHKDKIELTDAIIYKALQRRLVALDLLTDGRARAQHALRRAGNSAMRDAGVSESDARKITHSPNLGNMSDRYDAPAWKRLSECVLKVRFPKAPDQKGTLLQMPVAAGAEESREVSESGRAFQSVSGRVVDQAPETTEEK